MAKDTQGTRNEDTVFSGGRRNRLFSLRSEVQSFRDSILGSVGRTAETYEVLSAMDYLLDAINETPTDVALAPSLA